MKVKSLSRVQPSATPWTAAYQAPPSMDFPGRGTGEGCHCLLRFQKHCLPFPASPRVTCSLQTLVYVTRLGKWVLIQNQLQQFRPSSPEDPAFSFLTLTSVRDHGGSELQEPEPISIITVPSDVHRCVPEQTPEEH